MDQHGGFGMQSLHPHQRLGFKLVVHDARPLPAQHVCAGLTLNVAPKVAVRRPEDLLTKTIQMVNEFHGDAGGHHPVGAGLHRGGRIGIDHDGAVRMGVAKGVEFLNRTAQIQ